MQAEFVEILSGLLEETTSISFRKPARLAVDEANSAVAGQGNHTSGVSEVTNLSREQMKLRLRQLFVEIDANADGIVSWHDYSSWSVAQSAQTSDTVLFTDAVRPYSLALDILPSSSTTRAPGVKAIRTAPRGSGGAAARVGFTRPVRARPLRKAHASLMAAPADGEGEEEAGEDMTFAKVGGKWVSPLGPEPSVVIKPTSTRVGMVHVPKSVLQHRLAETLSSEEAMRAALLDSHSGHGPANQSTRGEWLHHQVRHREHASLRTGAAPTQQRRLAGSASAPNLTPLSERYLDWASFAPILRDTFVPDGYVATTADVSTAHSNSNVRAKQARQAPTSVSPGIPNTMLAARRITGSEGMAEGPLAGPDDGPFSASAAHGELAGQSRNAIEFLRYFASLDVVAKIDTSMPGVELWNATDLTPYGLLIDDMNTVERGPAWARTTAADLQRSHVIETRKVEAVDVFTNQSARQPRSFACTSAANGTLSLWDLGTKGRRGEVVRFPKLATWSAGATQTALQFWEKYSVLYAGDDEGEVSAWDVFHTVRMSRSKPCKGMITGLVPLPELDALVVGSADHTAVILDAMTGAVHVRHAGHRRAVVGVDYLAHRRLVLTASVDHDARVWSASVPVTIMTLSGHMAPLVGVSAVQGTSEVITASLDGAIKVWDLRKPARAVQTLHVSRTEEAMRIRLKEVAGMARSRADSREDAGEDFAVGTGFVGAATGGVQSARGTTSTPAQGGAAKSGGAVGLQRAVQLARHVAHGTVMRGFAVCHGRHPSILAGFKHIQRFRQARAPATSSVTHDDLVTGVIVDSFHASIITCSGGQVFVWSVLTGQLENKHVISSDRITALGKSADGGAFVTGTDKGAIAVMSMGTGHKVRTLQAHTAEVVAFACLGHHLVSAGRDGRVLLHEDPFTTSFSTEAAPFTVVCGAAFPQRLLQTFARPSAAFGHAASGERSKCSTQGRGTPASRELDRILQRPKAALGSFHEGEIRCVAARGQAGYIASGDSAGVVLLFKASSAHCEAKLQHASAVNAVVIPPHEDLILTADDTGSILVWRLDRGVAAQHVLLAGWRHVPHSFYNPQRSAEQKEIRRKAQAKRKAEAHAAALAAAQARQSTASAAIASLAAAPHSTAALSAAVDAVADAARESVQATVPQTAQAALQDAKGEYEKLLAHTRRQAARDALASVFGARRSADSGGAPAATASGTPSEGKAPGRTAVRAKTDTATASFSALTQHAVITKMLWHAGTQALYTVDDDGLVCRWHLGDLLHAIYEREGGTRARSLPSTDGVRRSMATPVRRSRAGADQPPSATVAGVATGVGEQEAPRPARMADTTAAATRVELPSINASSALERPKGSPASLSLRARQAKVRHRKVAAKARRKAAASAAASAARAASELDPYAPLATTTSADSLLGSPHASQRGSGSLETESSLALSSSGKLRRVGSAASSAVWSEGGFPAEPHADAGTPGKGLSSRPRSSAVRRRSPPSGQEDGTPEQTREVQPVPSSRPKQSSIGTYKLKSAVLRFFQRCPLLHPDLPGVFDLPIIASTVVSCDWMAPAHTSAGAALAMLDIPGTRPHIVSAGMDQRVVATTCMGGDRAGLLVVNSTATRNPLWDVMVDVGMLRGFLLAEEVAAKGRARSSHAGGQTKRATPLQVSSPTPSTRGSSRLSIRQSASRKASRGTTLDPLSQGSRYTQEVQKVLRDQAASASRASEQVGSVGKGGLLSPFEADWPDDGRPSSAWLRKEADKLARSPRSAQGSPTRSTSPGGAFSLRHGSQRGAPALRKSSLPASARGQVPGEVSQRARSALALLHSADDLGRSLPV